MGDLARIAHLGDEEALKELGLRFLFNIDEYIHPDDCPDYCTTAVCPVCKHKFDI